MAKQSLRDRMDESEGMSRADYGARMRAERTGMGSKTFNVPDNQQSFEVRKINTNSEQYDLNRIRPYSDGSKGYPSEAWNYKY